MIDHLINADEAAETVIRDRVAKILKCEFANQLNVYKNEDCRDVKFFAERRTPIDARTEKAVIVLSLWKGKYDNKHADYVDGLHSFVLDFLTSCPDKGDLKGDALANMKAQRLYTLVRYILEHSMYETLEFDRPFILHHHIKEYQVLKFENEDRSESGGVAQLQAVFEVRCGQETVPATKNLVAGSDTVVKLEETNSGYEYTSTY